MAKPGSTISAGLFGPEHGSVAKDVESCDTPLAVVTTDRKQQEDNAGGRKAVEVAKSKDQPQEVGERHKKPSEVTINYNKPQEDWGNYQTHQGNHSGQKTRRMCVAMPDEAYRFIRREAIKRGMTYGEYIYALAQAAVEKEDVK